MSYHRGFGFHRHHDGAVSIHAQELPDTGAWIGAGMVGTMPDRALAKSYVDWLHKVGPEAARIVDIPAVAVAGHLVTVPAHMPDGNACLLDVLDRIADTISQGMEEDTYYELHGLMTRAVHSLEIADDGKRAAHRSGDDILKPGNNEGMYSLQFRKVGENGTVGSSDMLVTGLGTGWIERLADRLAVVKEKALVSHPSDPRYARDVFVEGPEILVGKEAIIHLREVQKALASSAGRWTNTEYRGKVVEYVRARLPQVMDGIRASLVQEAPAFR